MIVEAGTLRIREANPAAHTLVGARPASLAGKKILTFIDKSSHDAVQSLVGAALVSDTVSPGRIRIARGQREVMAAVSGFTQDRGQFLLVRLVPATDRPAGDFSPVLALVDQMPDAFVVADSNLEIVTAIEDTAAEFKLPVVLEGYEPPSDPRLASFRITPDPGVPFSASTMRSMKRRAHMAPASMLRL